MSRCWSDGVALLVLDLALHDVDDVARLHLQGDGLARQGLERRKGKCVDGAETFERKKICMVSCTVCVWYSLVEGGRAADS
jgi:hypothetical protein